jgi:large subunit ribosomal protein L20
VPRVTRGTKRRQRRKKILARAKGFYQNKSKLYRYAKEAVDRSQKFAYVGRKLKKRDFRSLWIIRISAGTRQAGLSYSRFMNGLKVAGVEINRKMLAEMAVHDPDAFRQLTAMAQTALGMPVTAPPPPRRTTGRICSCFLASDLLGVVRGA